MLPDQGCLVYSGREITSLEMSFSWLAGPQLTAVPPEHLWSLRLTGVHAAVSRDPGRGNPNLPSVNVSLRGSKVRYFKKVFFSFLSPWSFLWPPISNHSLPSTLSFPPQVHFSSMARSSTMSHIFLVCLVYWLAPYETEVPGEYNVFFFPCCSPKAYNSAWHIHSCYSVNSLVEYPPNPSLQ